MCVHKKLFLDSIHSVHQLIIHVYFELRHLNLFIEIGRYLAEKDFYKICGQNVFVSI